MDPDEQPSADDIVNQYWPYDGPHGDEASRSAATAIERLTRHLNNATQTSAGVPYAATAGHIISALRNTTALQQQLLEQLAAHLTAHADDPKLYDWVDTERPPRDTALHAARTLAAAETARSRYAATLSEVSAASSRLSGSSNV